MSKPTLALSAILLALFQPPASFAYETASDDLIVKLKPAAQASIFVASPAMRDSGDRMRARAVRDLAEGRTLLVRARLAELVGDPAVEWAEPDYKVHALFGKSRAALTPPAPAPIPAPAPPTAAPSAPWGLQKINAAAAVAGGLSGRGIIVAVIDTGVDVSHPALAGRTFVNPREIPGNGIDDDGNGYVDDVSGWDFVNHDNDPMDDHGHGTHCAGTIAGDVVGIATGVTIMPLKFLARVGGGSTADAILAIRYAVQMGAKVLSNSWGGGDYSQGLKDAIEYARANGVVFVAAAGNNAGDNDDAPFYPGSYLVPGIVTVAATDASDRLASFSNYGDESVHVAAPGVDVKSLAPDGKYATLSGTSMATPHVAGVVALMLERGIAPSDIQRVLAATSDAKPGLHVVASGRINAYQATR